MRILCWYYFVERDATVILRPIDAQPSCRFVTIDLTTHNDWTVVRIDGTKASSEVTNIQARQGRHLKARALLSWQRMQGAF